MVLFAFEKNKVTSFFCMLKVEGGSSHCC